MWRHSKTDRQSSSALLMPNANTNDYTCVPVIIGCTDASALNYDSLANTNNGCIYPIYGCTDPNSFNYDPNSNVDDSTCVPYIYGCLDVNAINYDSLANTNVGCVYPFLGCTDPSAFNYNPLANVDDSTCVPVIIGCIDINALNYDSTANTNNGCIYPRWEDKHNKNGGYWSFKVPKEHSSTAWFELMVYIIGEHGTNDPNNTMQINGISVSPKKNFCIFKIWNKDYNKSNKNILSNFDFLNMNEVIYSNHQDNIKKDKLKSFKYNKKKSRYR